MNPHLRRQIRLFLHHWHRRTGVAAAAVIILVTVTGIALNHTGSLELDQQYPQSSWLLWPYESTQEVPQGIEQDGVWWWSDGQQLHRGSDARFPCRRLLGGAKSGGEYLLRCRDQWLWLTEDGQLLDELDPALFGVSLTTRVMANDSGFWLQSSKQQSSRQQPSQSEWQRLDLDMYAVVDSDSVPLPLPVSMPLLTLPASMVQPHNQSITWQRVLLDLHSGRWFGALGPWLVDLAALMLLFLSCSGFWIWYSRRH